MAEGFFNAAVRQDPKLSDAYRAFSAGIMAMDGDSASNNAIMALKEGWGIDISSHKVKTLKYEYIKDADLILTMTKAHKDAALHLFPGMDKKIFTLKEYAANLAAQNLSKCKNNSSEKTEDYDENLQFYDKNQPFKKYKFDYKYDLEFDIPDPYGKPLDFYKYCAQEIKNAIDTIIENIKLVDDILEDDKSE